MVQRSPLVHLRREPRITIIESDLADIEMLGHLPGKRHDAGQIRGLAAVFRQPSVVQSDHCREVSAAGNAGDEHLFRIATIAGYVPDRPRNSCGSIAYRLLWRGIGQQPVSAGDESHRIVIQRLRRPQERPLRPLDDSAAVEIYDRGKVRHPDRKAHVELTAVTRIFAFPCQCLRCMIRDVPFNTELPSGQGRIRHRGWHSRMGRYSRTHK